jgi:hypothetical protein
MLLATVIGDVVRSRRSADRGALHARLADVLVEVNDTFDPVTPLRVTVGDEYQGGFASVNEAVRATLRLRLALAPGIDVRHGIGWGEVVVLQEEPRVEDGSGWWSAREAVHAVKDSEERPGSRLRRTVFRRADGVEGPDPATLEAMLILRDQLVGDLSERSVRVLRGLLDGTTQRALADDLGVSASAVSQRIRADGLAAIVAADRALAVVL